MRQVALRLWGLLAAASWKVGRREAALTAIDRALALAPSGHFAVHKGWMLCQTGDLARAEATLIDAIARFPDCTSAHRNLAQVYKNWERWDAGAVAAEHACAEDPGDFDMRESWASCLIAAGRPREAITVIETGLKLFDAAPAVFQLLMRKAEAHRRLAEVDGAIDASAKADDLVRGNEVAREDFPGAARLQEPQLWESLATDSWNSGRREAALIAIDRALALAPSGHFAVHKGWMLCQTGDLARAEATLIDAIVRFPDCKSAHRNLAQVYKTWERWDAAAQAAEHACAEDPDDFDMRESWASCLIAAGRPREAITVIEDGLKLFDAAPAAFQLLMCKAQAHRRLAEVGNVIDATAKADDLVRGNEAAREDFPGAECLQEPQLWEALATESWNSGRRDAALIAIDRALALAPSGHFAVHKGWMLCQTGDLARAEATLIDAIARFPDCTSAHRNLAQVYKNWERWDVGAAAAQHACAENPGDFDMRESWASCLIAAGHPREAISVIEAGLKLFDAAPAAFQLLMRKAQAHRQLDEVDSAIDAAAKAVELVPDNEAALEELCDLMSNKSRRSSDAKPFLLRLREIQARRLPERLSDGLAEIWRRTHDIPLDEGAVKWAWELADKSVRDGGRWRAAAAWGKEASLLLRRWRETKPPPQLRQIDELIDKPDMSRLFAASVERRASFLVGAHVGPSAVALNMFTNSNRPFRWVGSADRGRLDHEMAIPVVPNSISTVRGIIGQIKEGALIGLMGDEATYSANCLRLEFLGRGVELPPQVPRLIQRCNAASFWCCPLWHDGRITIELEQLPDPMEGEPADAWSRRWFMAYLRKLAGVMRGQPENLRLFSGIWANVSRTYVRESETSGHSRVEINDNVVQ